MSQSSVQSISALQVLSRTSYLSTHKKLTKTMSEQQEQYVSSWRLRNLAIQEAKAWDNRNSGYNISVNRWEFLRFHHQALLSFQRTILTRETWKPVCQSANRASSAERDRNFSASDSASVSPLWLPLSWRLIGVERESATQYREKGTQFLSTGH